MDYSPEEYFQLGFDEYFEGRGYSYRSNVNWMNGWGDAERQSRGGNFDKLGRPSPCYA